MFYKLISKLLDYPDAELIAHFGEVTCSFDGTVLLGPSSVGVLLAPPPTGTIPVVVTD